ncbi:hypothetical protein O181_113277 [Austropuccinia psidii MF-1]|uniref:Uncharacterized protein n=1 Tax=Austropuccinia psidii MF-1 TaxID=1389203 RepID=A0A9Q3PV69_9BASI|nr:hypothetical protein [Austropuccinia psidii MF-1]
MSSKLTELTESSPSAPPPSVLCGSGIFSQFSSPSMASSGHFDPSQTYDGCRAVEILDPACTKCLAKECHLLTSGGIYGVEKMDLFGKELPVSEAPTTPDETAGFSQLTGSRQRDVARWTNVGGPIPVGGRPIYSSSEVPISRINTEGVVRRIRRIADSPTDPDAEGTDELDASCQVIPSTPRTFQPVLASIPTTIPPSSPSTSLARPALNPAVRPSPSQQPRNSPIATSQQLQPVASSSRRRDGLSPLPFPAAQVFQRRDCWPI